MTYCSYTIYIFVILIIATICASEEEIIRKRNKEIDEIILT